MDNEKEVRVRVPATTSNCGPGFDTLGMALTLYNTVSVRILTDNMEIKEADVSPMIREMQDIFFQEIGVSTCPLEISIEGDVPLAKGLGSSVTVRAGILAGLNALFGEPLKREKMVEVVSAVEGHPDNASAAILGGFCVARSCPDSGRYLDTARFPVDGKLKMVVVSPDTEILTDDSRRALPLQIPFNDVVKSVNSLAYIVSAFASGEYGKLHGSVSDFLHQPYREPAIPGAREAIESGIKAGAFTGWLSGSGPSVLCVSENDYAEPVGVAMQKAFADNGSIAKVKCLSVDNEGLCVLSGK